MNCSLATLARKKRSRVSARVIFLILSSWPDSPQQLAW